jgi:hypothetical protein
MPEIGTSGSMSEDGKRGVAKMAEATASILDSTAKHASAARCDRQRSLQVDGDRPA